METLRQIEQRRKTILHEMDRIRSMDRSTLNEQMLPVRHKGESGPVLRGPYYVLSRWEGGRAHSRRVRGQELKRLKRDVDNHRRFKELCEEFVTLTERLGALERQEAADMEALKKGLKSRSRRAPKSPA